MKKLLVHESVLYSFTFKYEVEVEDDIPTDTEDQQLTAVEEFSPDYSILEAVNNYFRDWGHGAEMLGGERYDGDEITVSEL